MIKEHIERLRAQMAQNGIDVYYFNTLDYHMSEYVPAYFKTIEYFSGFTGSTATLLIDLERAYIFVDGRYHGQADNEVIPYGIEVIKLGTKDALDPLSFIEKYYQNKTVGIDGKRTSITFGKALENKDVNVVSQDIYSEIIENRAPLSKNKITELSIKYTGYSRKQKIQRVLKLLNGKCHIINNLESIAYLLNLRADDVANTPVFLSYLIFIRDNVYLFVNYYRFDAELLQELIDDGIKVASYDDYYVFLEKITNQVILLDENKINYETYLSLKENNSLCNMLSIVDSMKAVKNETEIVNIKKAHIFDGVAMVKFLKWIDEKDKSKITEYDAARYLNECRMNAGAFDLSFAPIVAYNANAAMMHYAPSKDKCTKLANKGILLIDSGGQYLEGTTDITRTIALGEVSDEFKKHFTIVLKSMFNLSSLKFLQGMTGNQIDVVARRDIWDLGINYLCGTGHGVGYVSSVHECPPNIRYMTESDNGQFVPLKPGHVFSDEPGIYLDGKYGIRCENMLLCKKSEENEYGQFLEFETLTMCPFDTRLIDKKYLDKKTTDLLNKYHKLVYESLAVYLDKEERDFLKRITKKI